MRQICHPSIALHAIIILILSSGVSVSCKRTDHRVEMIRRIGGVEALKLREIRTGEEPYTITFAIPLNYQVMTFNDTDSDTNDCWLELSDNGATIDGIKYYRTNGSYIIEYATPFSPPGVKHLMKAMLVTRFEKISGPLVTVYYTNVFRFEENVFGPTNIAINCNVAIGQFEYDINIYSTNRELIKVITGQSTNGEISTNWNLCSSSGTIRSDNEFFADFYVKQLYLGMPHKGDNILVPTNPCHYNYLRDNLSGPPRR